MLYHPPPDPLEAKIKAVVGGPPYCRCRFKGLYFDEALTKFQLEVRGLCSSRVVALSSVASY